jgi:hypothetical protein
MGGLDPPIQLRAEDGKLDGRLKAGHGERNWKKQKSPVLRPGFSFQV